MSHGQGEPQIIPQNGARVVLGGVVWTGNHCVRTGIAGEIDPCWPSLAAVHPSAPKLTSVSRRCGWAYSLPLGRDVEHAYGDRERIVAVLVAHLIEQIRAGVVAFALRQTPYDFLDARIDRCLEPRPSVNSFLDASPPPGLTPDTDAKTLRASSPKGLTYFCSAYRSLALSFERFSTNHLDRAAFLSRPNQEVGGK